LGPNTSNTECTSPSLDELPNADLSTTCTRASVPASPAGVVRTHSVDEVVPEQQHGALPHALDVVQVL
jgi:hypothetical protein